MTSQSKSIRMAAKCCLTVGGDPGCCSIYAAMIAGRKSVSSKRFDSHQSKNSVTACAYAARVFLLRMLAAKNSMNRHPAFSPARAMAAGSRSRPARVNLPLEIGTMERVKRARNNDQERLLWRGPNAGS